MLLQDLITIDPDILGGQPVFKGTRVPIESLFDHLEAGISLDDFLDDFPTVSKEQAIATLEIANKLLTAKMSLNFMKLLLDENLPKRLKRDFPDHEIYTVRDKAWNGIKNGPLLQLMLNNNFDAFLTFDKNLQHQQNFNKYTIAVFVLSAFNNTYMELTKLSSIVHNYLDNPPLRIGPIIIKTE